MTFKDIKDFVEANNLSEDTVIFVSDAEEGSEEATSISIENEEYIHFRLAEPRLLIQ